MKIHFYLVVTEFRKTLLFKLTRSRLV